MAVPGTSDLEAKVYAAYKKYSQGDQDAIEDIFRDLMPFCLRVCARTCNQYISSEDDEASVAGVAIWEAFRTFDPERGRILMYIAQVVKNRVIDYKRQQKKTKIFPFSSLQWSEKNVDIELSENTVENILEELARQQEVEKLSALLEDYGVTFKDLAASGPKQKRSRENAKKAAWIIAGKPEFSSYLLKKKMLPVTQLVDLYDFNRKAIEKYRKFIVTNALIIIYDLSCLKPYTLPDEGGSYDV